MVKGEWCAVTATSTIIASKWKLVIIDRLLEGSMRFNHLKRSIPEISSKVLIANLIELQKDDIIKRTVYPDPPVRVNYSLTEKGMDLKKVMKSLEQWANNWLSKNDKDIKNCKIEVKDK
jgi:DNA-binding HxlR family transcriptional regulator